MGKRLLPIGERFWESVDKTPGFGPQGDCWRWTGETNKRGHGRVWIDGPDGKRAGRTAAHRVAWELFHNAQMPAHLHGCHTCDNPGCVYPLHIYPGTPQMNTLDMRLKGRWKRSGKIRSDAGKKRPPEHIARGEQAGAAKLTEQQVLQIYDRVKDGEPRKRVAQVFNISKPVVMKIAQGRTWKHLNLTPLPPGIPGRRHKEKNNVI